MKLGIIQGRLLPPVSGHIQEFPIENWKKEFSILKRINLNHIEWIITKHSYYNNPLFLDDLSNFPISSICCDHLIDEQIHNISFLKENLIDVCSIALKNNITNISIPLLEQSNMENELRRREFIDSILEIKRICPQIKFLFETELSPLKTLEIANSHDDFLVTYDTGNITSYSNKHEEYIKTLNKKIVNVHLKDRTYKAKTVFPFTGDTNFHFIFELLKEIGYSGIYTMQLARSDIAKEEEYISYCKKTFEKLHDKYFI